MESLNEKAMDSWNMVRNEAKELGIFYAGLTQEKLAQRIKDKKDGTGIYATSKIDPDARIEVLIEKAEELGIPWGFKSHDKLVELINKKLTARV